MKAFFAWIDVKYLAIVVAVVIVFAYDSVQAGMPERLRSQVGASSDAAFVVSQLAHADPRIAEAARENISRTPDRFAPELIGALANGNQNLRVAALAAIVDLGVEIDPDLIEPLLSGDSPRLSVQALRYLSKRGADIDAQVVKDIYILATDTSDKAALIESGTKYFPPDEASEFLIRALFDADRAVKIAAINAADALPGEPGLKVLIDALQYKEMLAPFAMHAIRRRGDKAFDVLLKSLGDMRSAIRAGAAELLGDIGDARALEPLTELFVDTSTAVGKAAGRSAGKLADDAHLQMYLEIIQGSRPDSIRAIPSIYALGAAKWPDAGPRLMQLASDPGFPRNLRYASFYALGEMGYPEGQDLLIDLASDKEQDELIRRETTKALGWCRTDGAFDFLKRALVDDTDFQIRIAAAHALGMRRDRPDAVAELMSRVDEESNNRMVLSAIVEAMGELGDPAAVPAIEAARAKGVWDSICDTALDLIALSSPE